MTGHKLMNARADSCRPVRDDQKDRPSLPVLADAPDRGWCRSVGRYAPPRINPLTAPTAHIHGEARIPCRQWLGVLLSVSVRVPETRSASCGDLVFADESCQA